MSCVSLADLDTKHTEAPVEAIPAVNTRAATPDCASRTPRPARISEDGARSGDGAAATSPERTRDSQPVLVSSLLPFEFPALRAFLGS